MIKWISAGIHPLKLWYSLFSIHFLHKSSDEQLPGSIRFDNVVEEVQNQCISGKQPYSMLYYPKTKKSLLLTIDNAM